MKTEEDRIETLKQLAQCVGEARRLHEQWNGYGVKQFDQDARQEFQTYQQGFEQTLEQLLAVTKLKPKRWDSFRHDKNLLAEKLTRNTFARDLKAQIAYYCAELVAAIKFLTWLFSESKANMKLKQRWAIDALDDIEVFAYKLVRLIHKHLNVELDFMTLRPSNIWAVNYQEALRGFNSGGVRDWRLVPPLIRTYLERAFLEPIFYGRDLELKEKYKKYIPYSDLHGHLKGSSFRNQFRKLDKLLYIYGWASVHTHWGRRYSVGACWFIANYVTDFHVDEELLRWIENNAQEFQSLLKKFIKEAKER